MEIDNSYWRYGLWLCARRLFTILHCSPTIRVSMNRVIPPLPLCLPCLRLIKNIAKKENPAYVIRAGLAHSVLKVNLRR